MLDTRWTIDALEFQFRVENWHDTVCAFCVLPTTVYFQNTIRTELWSAVRRQIFVRLRHLYMVVLRFTRLYAIYRLYKRLRDFTSRLQKKTLRSLKNISFSYLFSFVVFFSFNIARCWWLICWARISKRIKYKLFGFADGLWILWKLCCSCLWPLNGVVMRYRFRAEAKEYS